jgi:hypothetical protein
MPGSDWDYFMSNYYGDPYMMWHDGIDEKSVVRLEGEERIQAEDMLIKSLEEGSHYGAIGLRELRSQRAVPHLLKMLRSSQGTLAVETAVALSVIQDSFDYVPHIIGVLRSAAFWSNRISAARALRRFPKDEVVEALFESVASDPDYLVRNHASETLLFLHGMEPSISSHEEIFGHMIVDPDREKGVSREAAFSHYKLSAELLRKLIAEQGKLRSGGIIADIWTWKY